MKNFYFTIAIIFLSFPILSQIDTLDLSKYKLPEIFYESLNGFINLNSDGSNYFRRSTDDSHIIDKDFYLDSSIGLSYYKYINSSKWQSSRSGSVNFYPTYSFESYENADLSEHEKNLRLPIVLRLIESKKYFYKERKFYQYGGTFESDNFYYHIKYSNQDDLRDLNLNLNLSPEFLFGWGRIEDVTEIWHANRMLLELDRVNLLEKNVGIEGIMSVADLLVQRKRNRYFDHRIDRMEDYENLDDLFQSLGIKKSNSIRYFNTLQDMWLYGVNTRRYAGKIFAIGLTTLFSNDLNYYGNEFKRFNSTIGVKSVYEYHKPIDMIWQFYFKGNYTFSVPYSFYYGGETNNGKFTDLVNRLNLSSSVGWYPTTRTDAKSELAFNLTNQINIDRWNDEKLLAYQIFLRWRNNFNYYLSPRSRLGISFDFNYIFRSDPPFTWQGWHTNSFNYDLSINYSLYFF